MKQVSVKNIVIGEGTPKICVSIIGKTEEDIYNDAEKLKALPVDIVEWRVDCYEYARDIERILHVLPQLKSIIGEYPLLFTVRTKSEGGETAYYPEIYKAILRAALQSGEIDIVDIELFKGDEMVSELMKEAQREGCLTLASNHDFQGTPDKEVIMQRLLHMQKLGADILKIAVMPQNAGDVITLLDATREMVEEKATQPVVTMSMSSLGMISRVSGEVFGSAITFGAGEHVSAPGQIETKELDRILKILHI